MEGKLIIQHLSSILHLLYISRPAQINRLNSNLMSKTVIHTPDVYQTSIYTNYIVQIILPYGTSCDLYREHYQLFPEHYQLFPNT